MAYPPSESNSDNSRTRQSIENLTLTDTDIQSWTLFENQKWLANSQKLAMVKKEYPQVYDQLLNSPIPILTHNPLKTILNQADHIPDYIPINISRKELAARLRDAETLREDRDIFRETAIKERAKAKRLENKAKNLQRELKLLKSQDTIQPQQKKNPPKNRPRQTNRRYKTNEDKTHTPIHAKTPADLPPVPTSGDRHNDEPKEDHSISQLHDLIPQDATNYIPPEDNTPVMRDVMLSTPLPSPNSKLDTAFERYKDIHDDCMCPEEVRRADLTRILDQTFADPQVLELRPQTPKKHDKKKPFLGKCSVGTEQKSLKPKQ